MEKWQVFYLFILGIGFVIGLTISPIISLVFIWSSIAVTESVRYWREIRKFGEENED